MSQADRQHETELNLLFICSRNRLRSPTAESVFSHYAGVQTLSAGTSADAETPLSADLIEWSDIIFAMESTHRRLLNQRFQSLLRNKKIVVLDIPDIYGYMDPDLVEILKAKVPRHLKL